MSLLHDLPPILSINELLVPVPHDNNLWHAESSTAWIEHYQASNAFVQEDLPSLKDLFRGFIQGRLTYGHELPFHHLRLLLHPLQATVFEQQQTLRVFGVDKAANRSPVFRRRKEMQDLLQQMASLLTRTSDTDENTDGGEFRSIVCVSMIMLHLISLNLYASISEIESVAEGEPPTSLVERAELWSRVRYIENERSILFHAGQVFRILDELLETVRLPWWPIAAYRAALACWSLSQPDNVLDMEQPEISINTLLPDDPDLMRYRNEQVGTAVMTLPDGRRMGVLEGENSLHYCISLLRNHRTRLVRKTQAKLVRLVNRWSF